MTLLHSSLTPARLRLSRTRGALLAAGLLLTPLAAFARGASPSFSLGAGTMVAPVYDGSSSYTATLLPVLRAVAPTQDFGTFTAAFPEGLRWDLPVGDTLGVALLGNYDMGRKERIRTFSGHNTHLRGMGDLGGTAQAGLELSLNLEPYRLFVRGMQALRDRQYGGRDLGRTAYLDAGLGSEIPLGNDLTMDTETFVTWSDRDDMMARYGVTPAQAAHSGFHAHQVGGGLRGVTMQWGLDWQWTQQVSIGGGVRLTALSSSAARNSPLVDKTVGGGLFMNALYTF